MVSGSCLCGDVAWQAEGHRVPDAKFFTNCFCRRCGSKLPRVDPSREIAVVPAGCLDHDPGARPQMHIFVGSKAPWHEISDSLPRFDAASPTPPRP